MKNVIRHIIIRALFCIVFIAVWCLLRTYTKTAFDIIIDIFGAFYIGRLMGKIADWLCDNKETK